MPDFARWLDRERKTENSAALTAEDRTALQGLDRQGWWQLPQAREPMQEPLLRAAAWYFLRAQEPPRPAAMMRWRASISATARGSSDLNWLGDGSENGISQSYGLMVNYLYDLDDIEKNHEAYAEGHKVVASACCQAACCKVPADRSRADAGIIRASIRSTAASF